MNYKILKKMLACTSKKPFSENMESVNYCDGVIWATDNYIFVRIIDKYYSNKGKTGETYKIDSTLIKGKSPKEIFEADEYEFSGIVARPLSLNFINTLLKIEDEYGVKIKYDKVDNVATGIDANLLIKVLNVFNASGYSQPKIIDTGTKIHLIAEDEYISISAVIQKCRLK